MSDKAKQPFELDIERLARMASADDSWWQECDRQPKPPRTYWAQAVAGVLIASAFGCVAFIYALVS